MDPATGQPLPNDAIQRVLLPGKTVCVYNIPPLTSLKGHTADSWTSDPARHIFTAILRVVETAYDTSSGNNLKVDIVLEDDSNGQLFAAAPYIDRSVVEPVLDSSRFFALTVRDPEGRKAVLGIGFAERSDAFDLAVVLQEARRVLGLEAVEDRKNESKPQVAKDYSLKEGETITVKMGGKLGQRRPQNASSSKTSDDIAPLQSFALPPPPGAASSGVGTSDEQSGFALPMPPSAGDVKSKRRSLRDLGFDDGKFGEFA